MTECSTVRQLYDALVRGALEEPEAESLHAHVLTCTECREAYGLELLLVRAATTAPGYEPPQGFAAQVVERWQAEADSAQIAASTAYRQARDLASLSPYKIVAGEVRERLRSILDPMLEPFLPVCRETSTTLFVARDVLREASGVVIVELKQVLLGRDMPEAT